MKTTEQTISSGKITIWCLYYIRFRVYKYNFGYLSWRSYSLVRSPIAVGAAHANGGMHTVCMRRKRKKKHIYEWNTRQKHAYCTKCWWWRRCHCYRCCCRRRRRRLRWRTCMSVYVPFVYPYFLNAKEKAFADWASLWFRKTHGASKFHSCLYLIHSILTITEHMNRVMKRNALMTSISLSNDSESKWECTFAAICLHSIVLSFFFHWFTV